LWNCQTLNISRFGFLHAAQLSSHTIYRLAWCALAEKVPDSLGIVQCTQYSQREFNKTSNCAELCFAITATVKGKPAVAQTALTGSIVSNCLMSFGTCLLLGGVSQQRQSYPIIIACTTAELLVVSIISITLPTAFATSSKGISTEGHSSPLSISHGSAIVPILEFLSYILFFYHTHRDIDNSTPEASLQDGLIAGGCIAGDCLLVDVVAPMKGATQLLRTLRAAAQAEQVARDCKPRYPAYVGISILISGLTAQVFASWYILEAIESPGRSIQLSASFVPLIIILMVISLVN
jgi:Ca2+:H+ antiporter